MRRASILNRTFLRWVFSHWTASGLLILLVGSFTASAILDSAYTWLIVEKFGVGGESNPLVRQLFERGAGEVWVVINIASSFLAASVLGSILIASHGFIKQLLNTLFSAAFTLRVISNLYHGWYYSISPNPPGTILTLSAITIFLATWLLLAYGGREGRPSLGTLMRDLKDNIFLRIYLPTRGYHLNPFTAYQSKISRRSFSTVIGRMKDPRLWFMVTSLVLIPIIILSLIQIISNAVGVQSVEGAIRELGIVTQIQGVAFLISFLLIIVMTALLVYIVLSLWDRLAR